MDEVDDVKEKYSQKLRDISKEIQAIYKKHDVGGVFTLSDGEGFGEYRMILEEPTWSMMKFLKPDAIHLKVHAKSKPKESNMTVNMIVIQMDICGHIFMMLNKLKNQIKQTHGIEEEKGNFHHEDY